ncbi:membrane protein YczE [Actinomadura sediminis]|uniref:YitT family protein n=1 Tax=Actinomadura sediminis TaxID=1038904 RepID=A0ABW3EJS7_9ACTN
MRRLVQLYVGLALYGLGLALQLSSNLGNDPWDVLHEGLALRFGLTIGTWILIAGALVMLAWIPLKQRPGIGTISNVLLVGAFTDVFLWLLPDPEALAARAAYLGAAVLVGGFATGCYIGAGLGPGPRDGLMTGIAARGHSIRKVRTALELSVLAVGWLLGGTVGVGTVLYALAIGPLTHVFLPLLTIKPPEQDAAAPVPDGLGGPSEPTVPDAPDAASEPVATAKPA